MALVSVASPTNHTPTIRLLVEQVSTALKACGELRSDFKLLDGEVEQIKIALAKGPPTCDGCQALMVEMARLKERLSIAIGILSVLQVISTAIAAYLAAGR